MAVKTRASGSLVPVSVPVVLVAVAAIAVSFSGCGQSPAPIVQEPAKPATPPPPKPIALGALNPVAVDPGGTAAVKLQVERNGNEGPIQVQLSGSPEGITAKAAAIPAGQSAGQLELLAAEKLGDNELQTRLTVSVKVGELRAEQPLALTVNKVKLPTLVPVPDVVLQPGQTKEVDVAVQRNGYQGPLKLGVEGLPDKVTGAVGEVAADQNAAKLKLTAAADAADASATVRVAGTLYGRTIAAQIPLHVDRQPYRVQSFMAVTLKPGETKRVQVPVERRSYKGPVRLRFENLPPDVTVHEVEVAPDQAAATVEMTAAASAQERVRSAKVVSAAGSLSGADPIVVRVSRGGTGFLPRSVLADPELGPLFRRGSFGGRLTTETKQALLEAYGGTPESEEAVLRGLRWLAEHQQLNGRWSLKDYTQDVRDCNCHTQFEAEVVDNDTAGTAFGVLPFLGAGVAHNRAPEKPAELAEYRNLVKNAISFLAKRQVRSDDPLKDGSLDGNMYAHAVATIALCEAYGISGDERLKVPAQRAIKFLAAAQHQAGGWRYGPQQEGDMSAVGWVFLAIRSGQLAGLPLKGTPLVRAERFVDSCAAGPPEAKLSQYRYQAGKSAATPALSAAGLLTREYLGWKQDNPHLLAGCQYLMKPENLPPESGNPLGPIYYYYYATQVLHHMEGSDFDLWNHRMREHLIRTQEKEGHKAGSWNPDGADWGKQAGRLYATSMAIMTLEVYYRHLPMYRPLVVRTQEAKP